MSCRRAALVLGLLPSLALSGGAPPDAPRDVAAALARLSADSARERAAAERELGVQLSPADSALLAAAARAGSAEVRARIAAALMSDARHFALAAELAAASDSMVSDTGAAALAGLAAEWLGTSDQDPLPLSGVERAVRGAFSGLFSLDISRGELEPLLDQIARLVPARRTDQPNGAALAVVLDPSFDPRQTRPLVGAQDLGPIAVGTFDELLYATAVTHGALFDVYGWIDGRTWIVVRPSDVPDGRSAQALLLQWVLAVESPSSPRQARACARALAACGWPAALEWLDLRWSSKQDSAAFAGLLLAAGRGALAPSLESAAAAKELLERADRALSTLESPRQEIGELARALLTLGATGSPAWAAGYAAAPERGRLLRCALVANARRAPEDLLALLRARLQSPDTSSEERCGSLRAIAAAQGARAGEVQTFGLEAAFSWAVEHGQGRAFPIWLRAAGIREPQSWQDPRGLAPQAQVELCADALSRAGESPALRALAGKRVAALLAQPKGEDLALALLDRESLWIPRAALRSALEAAGAAGGEGAALARLSLAAGISTPEEHDELVEALFQRSPWSAADWNLAGAAIAKPGGVLDTWPRQDTEAGSNYAVFLERLEALREQLLKEPADAAAADEQLWSLDAGWVQGCERCVRLLRARQNEPGAREFLRRLRVLFQRSTHPLRRELSLGRFPPPSSALVVEVELREPWLGF